MHPTIENYLSKVNNLSQLNPEKLPFDVLEAMGEMNEVELFKTCSQLYVLQNNIPSQSNIVNLGEDEIIDGATTYAKAILKRIKE